MIIKTFEINKKKIDKQNFFLVYGENEGLKNEFKHLIKQNNSDAEIIIFNQDEVFKNENYFFNELNNISLFEKKKTF